METGGKKPIKYHFPSVPIHNYTVIYNYYTSSS